MFAVRTSGLFARLGVIIAALATVLIGTQATASADPIYETGPFRIVNSGTGGNLIPDGWGTNHSDGIVIWEVNGATTGNSWKLAHEGDGSYLIRNTSTNKCLRPGAFNGAKTLVTQGTCNSSLDFRWLLRPRFGNPNEVQIISLSSHEALSPYTNQPNQWVVLDPPSESPTSYWSLNRL